MLRKLLLALTAVAFLPAGAAVACPNWQAAPVFGQIGLNAGFLPDPFQRRITAGGRHNIARCLGLNWPGFVAVRPDFDLYWNGSAQRLTIYVDTYADSVLLINGPDGRWYFNDDVSSNDRRSGITFVNPQPGLYDIWLGSYDGSTRNPGVLVVTER